MISDEVTKGAKALQSAGYRITSIVRPGGRPSGHASGRAMDIAKWEYSTDYSRNDAIRIRDILNKTTGRSWLVVAEDDHVHAELSDGNVVGVKNRTTNNELELGDPMYGPSQALARAARRMNIALPSREFGDALAPASLSAPLVDVTSRELNQLALAVQTPEAEISRALTAVAKTALPEQLAMARQIAVVRAAMSREIKYIDYENAKEITSSVGNEAPLRQTDVAAVAQLISTGIPAFEPQVFSFANTGPTTWQIFPSHMLAIPNGGPLQPGELLSYIGEIIEITVPALTSNVGLQVTCTIEFGPAAMVKNSMSFLFRLGAGNEPVKLSIVHGVQTGGVSRLQPRQLTVNGGVPVPGASFPCITLTNLPFAAGYLPTLRPFQPGDRSVDRFSGLLGG